MKKQEGFGINIIHFFRGDNGKVCGIHISGKICIIDFNHKGVWVNENEDWEVEIISEEFNKIIVKPIKRILSAEDNQKIHQRMFQNYMIIDEKREIFVKLPQKAEINKSYQNELR